MSLADDAVAIPAGAVELGADLAGVDGAGGLVIFAHGSGSSRFSPRNQAVAAGLRARGLATLLLDLLAATEEADRRNVFDIDLITGRLVAATRWVDAQPALARLPLGYFGASTGAAAALVAAATGGERVQAVVSRGGRPDLAGPSLGQVGAPTLLIVGGDDHVVIDLNRAALAAMRCPGEMAVVPGAGHLFAEPGTLEQVTELAGAWFETHFDAPAGA